MGGGGELGGTIKIRILVGGSPILSIRLNAPGEIEVELEEESNEKKRAVKVERRKDITIKKEVIPGIPEPEIEEEKEEEEKRVEPKKVEEERKEEKPVDELFKDVIEGSPAPKEEVTSEDVGGEKIKEDVLTEFFKENEKHVAALKKEMEERSKEEAEKEKKAREIVSDLLGMV